MRYSLLLLPVLFTLSGCFETYEGSLSATAGASTVAWSVTQGLGPTLNFRIANDDLDDAISNVRVRVRVEIVSGGGRLFNDEPTLMTAVTGVSGSAGEYVIASLAPRESVTLSLRVNCEPGVYRWTVTVDPDQQVKEFTESDNTAITTVTVTQPALGAVNLAFGDLSTLTATPEGEDIVLEVPIVVTRTGNVPLPLVRIDLASDGVTGNYFAMLTNLAVGESMLDLRVVAPVGGSGQIAIYLDPSNFIPETDETDNVHVFAFPLGGMN